MAKWSTGLTIGSTALAVGLLVDNQRLRAELDTQSTNTATVAKGEVLETRRTSKRKPSATASPQADTPSNPSASAEEIEVQIEEEVAIRLKQAIDEKLDQGLNEIVDERVEQRMEQHQDRRKERFRAAMEEHIAEYVAEADLSDETEAQLISLMDESMSSLGEVFRAMHQGDIERETAWQEFGEIREEMNGSLVEMLGSEEAERFQEDIRGPLGSRGSRHR